MTSLSNEDIANLIQEDKPKGKRVRLVSWVPHGASLYQLISVQQNVLNRVVTMFISLSFLLQALGLGSLLPIHALSVETHS